MNSEKDVEVVVLCGGISSEREISLRSGRTVFELLQTHLPTKLIILERNELPEGLDRRHQVIFPMTHGEFGEDGRLQRLLEAGNFIFVGSGSESAALTMDKARTKDLLQQNGISLLPQICFAAEERSRISFDGLAKRLGASALFLKPNGRGSSLCCFRIGNDEQLRRALADGHVDQWLCEPYCAGRELTVGILQGRALDVVEIVPTGAFVDYSSKYTASGSRHLVPAPIGDVLTAELKGMAERIFQLCQCQDWARIDFLLTPNGHLVFLEVNAIPGFTATSFFPDSGRKLPPDRLLLQIVARALERIRRTREH